jgi:hypothetical protein
MSRILEAELELCPACGAFHRHRAGMPATAAAIDYLMEEIGLDLLDTCADLLVCGSCGQQEILDAELFERASEQCSGYVGWDAISGDPIFHLRPRWLAGLSPWQAPGNVACA